MDLRRHQDEVVGREDDDRAVGLGPPPNAVLRLSRSQADRPPTQSNHALL